LSIFSSFPTELRCSGLDWYEFGEFCYKPFGDKKTWHDAQDSCRSQGAELVSIRSMTEQSWLESYLYMGMYVENQRREQEDVKVENVLKSAMTFTYWAPGEPNNHDGFSEDCVEMLHQVGGFWDDKQCSEEYAFICEKSRPDITPPTNPPTPPPAQGCADGWTALPHFRHCYKVCSGFNR
uniref:C-type lectin domain-containing protein n=1 Tax=Echeneis naucrates TaxID=173247 RepID=A0A665UEY6_ECHNA